MSHLETIGTQRGVYYEARDLLARDFPEPKWAVDGLIPEGLTLLVGSPKLGKSWMVLDLALAITTGGRALGTIEVDAGPVLYCALEDTPRRLKDRLMKLLGTDPSPADLGLALELPPMPEATDLIEGWVIDHPSTRLVVIDVLRKIRRPADARTSPYDADYLTMSQLKGIADRHNVAVVVVHHSRKSADEHDVFNEASGSTGLTGAADAILYAKKARNTSEAVLHVTGRDIIERTIGMSWDSDSCRWTLLDEPAHALDLVASRRQITELLINWGDRHTPKTIAQALGANADTIRQTLRRMARDGQIETDGAGSYYLPDGLSQVSLPSRPGDRRDTCDSSTERNAS